MSDFQWALLAAAVAMVGGVWLFNLWQARSHRIAAERLFTGAAKADDVLLTSEVANEGMHDQPDTSLADDGNAAATVEEFLPWADSVSDCLVRFDVAESVSASAIWAAQSSWSDELQKSLRWVARENAAAPWQLVSHNDSGRYLHWLAALQLADRRGAVTDRELMVYFDGLQSLAVHLGIAVTLPGRSETLMRAQALDEFCASVDIQFSLQLVDGQGGLFVGTKLRGVCEAAGLVLQDDGGFHAKNAQGVTEYVVTNSASERFTQDNLRSLATNGVTLTLDVPRAADGVQAFNRMVGTARQLERGLGARLVDARRVELNDEIILSIRDKTAELQQLMVAARMPAGSALAMKLFS